MNTFTRSYRSLVALAALLMLALPVTVVAAPIPVSPAGTDAGRPVVAVSASGAIHIVWEQDDGIWHRMQAGGTWSASEWVGDGESPAIAVAPQGDVVYVAWSGLFDGNYEIFTRRWDGAGWSEGQNVSGNDGGSTAPAFAVSQAGAIHLIWSDTSPGAATLYHAESGDGLIWPNAAPIPNAPGSNPSAAISPDGRLAVVWQHRASFAERLRIWQAWFDGDWSTPVSLTDGSSQALAPQLAVDAQRLLLTWQEGERVRVAAATSVGWTPLAESSGRYPALAVTMPGDLYWGWEEDDALHARFQSGGWSATYPLGAAPARSLRVTTRGQVVHQTWSTQTDSAWQIVYDTTTLTRIFLPSQSHE